MPNETGNKAALHKKHVARQQREQQQTRIILYTFFGILAAVVGLLIYGWLDIKYFQLNRPVAKVGDTEILLRDFEPRVKLQRQNLLNQYDQYQQYKQYFGANVDSQIQQIQDSLNNPVSVGQTVLDQMVNEELVRQESAKRGITISSTDLDKEIQSAFNYFPNGSPTPTITPTDVVTATDPASAFSIVSMTPSPTGTPELETGTPTATEVVLPTVGTGTPQPTIVPSMTPTLTMTLTASPTSGPTATPSATATPYTLDGFNKRLTDANDGLTKLGFNEGIYKQLFEVQLLEAKLKEQISADVKNVQTEVWARHILVADEATAQDIIKQLQDGADFATLAAKYSTDTSNAANGGDLGWFGPGAMVPEFETAAFALKNPGDFTATPVKSSFGYHIIQLIAKQDRPLTADQIQTAKDKAYTDWLTAAKVEYGVETFDIWQARVPAAPNFETQATESAQSQLTAQSESRTQTATARPK